MKILKNFTGLMLSITAVFFSVDIYAEQTTPQHNHAHPIKTSHNEPLAHQKNPTIDTEQHDIQAISLSNEQIKNANIQIAELKASIRTNQLYAPGEVKANGYTSYVVSPRIDSVIISRHATLGQHVESGQQLVTLFSETMAQAQADYLITASEWQRVKNLDKHTMSERDLAKTAIDLEANYGRLIALGMTEPAIALLKQEQSPRLGQYTLTAQRSGAILQDDFSQGQRITAGTSIMLIADEQNLWVDAKVSPNKKLDLTAELQVTVEFEQQNFTAKVIQEAHTIDPLTRTRVVRLLVANPDDILHAGMFVNVNFSAPSKQNIVTVPESALMQSPDGDWLVFVEKSAGEFNSIEVKLGARYGNEREVFGLTQGSRIVIQGAFFMASELAKSGFEPHNH